MSDKVRDLERALGGLSEGSGRCVRKAIWRKKERARRQARRDLHMTGEFSKPPNMVERLNASRSDITAAATRMHAGGGHAAAVVEEKDSGATTTVMDLVHRVAVGDRVHLGRVPRWLVATRDVPEATACIAAHGWFAYTGLGPSMVVIVLVSDLTTCRIVAHPRSYSEGKVGELTLQDAILAGHVHVLSLRMDQIPDREHLQAFCDDYGALATRVDRCEWSHRADAGRCPVMEFKAFDMVASEPGGRIVAYLGTVDGAGGDADAGRVRVFGAGSALQDAWCQTREQDSAHTRDPLSALLGILRFQHRWWNRAQDAMALHGAETGVVAPWQCPYPCMGKELLVKLPNHSVDIVDVRKVHKSRLSVLLDSVRPTAVFGVPRTGPLRQERLDLHRVTTTFDLKQEFAFLRVETDKKECNEMHKKDSRRPGNDCAMW